MFTKSAYERLTRRSLKQTEVSIPELLAAMLFDAQAHGYQQALEAAALRCDEQARHGNEDYRDGAKACAANVRALKGKKNA